MPGRLTRFFKLFDLDTLTAGTSESFGKAGTTPSSVRVTPRRGAVACCGEAGGETWSAN